MLSVGNVEHSTIAKPTTTTNWLSKKATPSLWSMKTPKTKTGWKAASYQIRANVVSSQSPLSICWTNRDQDNSLRTFRLSKVFDTCFRNLALLKTNHLFPFFLLSKWNITINHTYTTSFYVLEELWTKYIQCNITKYAVSSIFICSFENGQWCALYFII